MADSKAYDEPLSVEIHEGEVVLRAATGPFGVSLTASAAAATADRLAEAAQTVLGGHPSQIAGERD